MKKRTLLFAFLMPVFTSAQTEDPPLREIGVLTLESEEIKIGQAALPPAKTDGPELFKKGIYTGYRKLDSVLIEPFFTKIEEPYGPRMVAKKGGYFGLVDDTGHELLPFEFEKLKKFEFPVLGKLPQWRWLMAWKNNKSSLLDSLGQPLVSFDFERTSWNFSDTVLILVGQKRQGFVGPNCRKPFFETRFDSIDLDVALPVPGFFSPVKNGKKALVSYQNGQTLLPFEFDGFWPLPQNWIIARKKSCLGIVSSEGKTILPFDFFRVEKVEPSHFLVIKNPPPKGCFWVVLAEDFESRFFLIDNTGEVRKVAGN